MSANNPGPGPRKAGPGRPKGCPNKSTRDAKMVMEMAFDKLGGVDALVAWGKTEPTAFYQIWSKIIPKDMVVTGSVDLAVTIEKARKRAIST